MPDAAATASGRESRYAAERALRKRERGLRSATKVDHKQVHINEPIKSTSNYKKREPSAEDFELNKSKSRSKKRYKKKHDS